MQILRFLLGDELREIGSLDPTLTVLEWLRGPARLTGTKEGCNEGDCGACTVVLVRPEDGRLHYRAVNACILFMGQLDGCQLLTVEHLRGRDGTLHPVQQAMVDQHGSQCGFCTPGFIMSLFALGRDTATTPDDNAIDDALAGNLCRCTGYAPIVRAARQACTGASDRFSIGDDDILARLDALADRETLELAGDGRRFLAPADIDALADLLAAHPEATIVAGSTDVALWVNKGLRRLDTLVWLGRVGELAELRETPDAIEIGAGVTFAKAFEVLGRHYPDIGEVFRRHGSTQTRNVGTIGGNIANGSPIGDSSPVLIAAGATLHLRLDRERRSLPLEDFFLGYGRQDRRPGEFVERITVPIPRPGDIFHASKVSKRFDQDISAVLGAFRLRMDGERIVEVRLAFGGMSAIPQRAAHAEAALAGGRLDAAHVAAAREALACDFTPLTDMRAGASYRLTVAGNLLDRLLREASPAPVDIRLARGCPDLARV